MAAGTPLRGAHVLNVRLFKVHTVNEDDFYCILDESGFPDWYYEFCARFAPMPGIVSVQKGNKSEVLKYFAEAEQAVKYDGKWRHYTLQLESPGTTQCSASFFFQRHGLELTFSVESGEFKYGSNLAVLARQAMQRTRPSFDPNPPYPRPDHNGDPNQLKAIINEFSVMAKKLCVNFSKVA
jgi:hypothetical protein